MQHQLTTICDYMSPSNEFLQACKVTDGNVWETIECYGDQVKPKYCTYRCLLVFSSCIIIENKNIQMVSFLVILVFYLLPELEGEA